MQKNIFIKISGDCIDSEEAFNFIKAKTQEGFVVVICGGGNAITDTLKNEGIPFEFSLAGRTIRDFKGRQLARDILEEHQAKIQDKFNVLDINALVEIPVLYVGGILCHINGDDFLKSITYNNYDELYCLTKRQRIQKKIQIFNRYPKVKIIGCE